jgi:hypothetical protein
MVRTGSSVAGRIAVVDAETATDVGGDGAQRVTRRQSPGAVQIDGEVDVAESERRVGSGKSGQFVHRPPRLAGAAPAVGPFLAGERVDDRVEIGRHVKTVDEIVVAGIDDYRDGRPGDRSQASSHPGPAHTAREHYELHRPAKVFLVMTASTELPSGLEDDPDHTPTPVVVAAVLFVDERSLPVSLEAVRTQVYGVDRVVILGGGSAVADLPAPRGADHMASYSESGEVAGAGNRLRVAAPRRCPAPTRRPGGAGRRDRTQRRLAGGFEGARRCRPRPPRVGGRRHRRLRGAVHRSRPRRGGSRAVRRGARRRLHLRCLHAGASRSAQRPGRDRRGAATAGGRSRLLPAGAHRRRSGDGGAIVGGPASEELRSRRIRAGASSRAACGR